MRVHDWLLTPARAAIHVSTMTAVVADLHLGYDRLRRRGGDAVPVRRVADELAPLSLELARQSVSRLVIAGDLFEDGRYQRDEVLRELVAWLVASAVELVAVVPGNHDRLGERVEIDGWTMPLFPSGIDLGGWHVVHGDGELPTGRVVQGHEHPWLRWRRGVEGPCYLVSDERIVLPALSADAAGANVWGETRWKGYRACAIAGDRVLDFGDVSGR
jgi:metallophosphoesterase superfamily enzyme